MSDTNSREASMPGRADDWRKTFNANPDDQAVGDDQAERDEIAPLFAKLAPRPSALGVTYSLI